MKNEKSNCCNAEIKTFYDLEGTACWICMKCEKACDPNYSENSQEKAEKKCTWCHGVEWHAEPNLNPNSPLYCIKCGYNESHSRPPQPESEDKDKLLKLWETGIPWTTFVEIVIEKFNFDSEKEVVDALLQAQARQIRRKERPCRLIKIDPPPTVLKF